MMKNLSQTAWLFILILVACTAFFMWGIRLVPFHPDESTQLFMSSDLEELLSHPWELGWQPDREHDLRQRYRELDAPLTKYILGIGRSLVGLPALPVDWDWSKDWEENRLAGALPDERLLYAARLAVSLLMPLSMILISRTGILAGGAWTGLLAALLLGMHALTLLHTRRAMAEGPLLFGTLLATWGFLKGDRYAWLAALGAALAYNAKQSTLALLPVGLLAVCWIPEDIPQRSLKILKNCVLYLFIFGLVTLLLNPLYWNHPLQAFLASWNARQDLLQRMISTTLALQPEQVLDSPAKRSLALLANLYLLPPSFAEVGNYLGQTAASEGVYMGVRGHTLLRGLFGGGIFFGMSLIGFLLGVVRLRQEDPAGRRRLSLLLLASLAPVIFHLAFVPLPWQRYVIPVLPFTCLWTAFGLTQFGRIQQRTASLQSQVDTA